MQLAFGFLNVCHIRLFHLHLSSSVISQPSDNDLDNCPSLFLCISNCITVLLRIYSCVNIVNYLIGMFDRGSQDLIPNCMHCDFRSFDGPNRSDSLVERRDSDQTM